MQRHHLALLDRAAGAIVVVLVIGEKSRRSQGKDGRHDDGNEGNEAHE
ncbi:hypothetical protein ebA7147 [Aromatoleum aromaticum EbN1]|uniref:Uncharacterized protein n=1 Tax=Aromatoleum aromaticum (strain DSM 19018 / LMG 30748 / EbN1) TaxID=76114 RepID=Q5NXN8_AROAE|nr:hypothetical protein ebA7147 [Aromatoleum aromaticum EbN1]